MSRVQLAPLRHLPIGRAHYRAMGQDGIDPGSFDTSGMDAAPIPSDYPIPDMPLPDFGIPSSDIYFGVGPAAPGEIISPPVPDLPSLILSGELPPPSGGGLSTDQVAQIAAAGGTPSDIQAILAGQASPSGVLQYLKTGIAVATQVKTLVSSPTPGRATPVTRAISPTAGTGAGTTSIAKPLSMFTQSSIISGVPNWVVFGGGLLALAALASAFGGSRR